MIFQKVISCALSPNTERDDVLAAWKILFKPHLWQKGESINEVENWFKEYFQASEAVSFNSGRSALLAILQSLGVGKGDEVLVQAFTCVAVPNSVLWSDAKPIYVDIDESLNLDPKDLDKKITPRTKAIIIQHTFGVPAQMEKILTIAKTNNLLVIEDCAHSLGARHQGKKIGTFGDAAFFSFGRDKVLSSVWGGVAITKHKVKLREFQKHLPFPNKFWVLQQLFHPIAFSLILRLYDIGLGKLILYLLQRLHLLSFPVYEEEKQGIQPKDFPAKYPNALALLLVNQFKKFEKYNRQRQSIANYYWHELKDWKNVQVTKPQPGAIYLRYPVQVTKSEELIAKAKSKGILLGNWYHHVIDPAGVNYRVTGCPAAQEAAKHILNLPTLISWQEATRVIQTLWLKL